MTNTMAERHATVQCPFCAQLNRVDLARLANGPKCGGCGRPLHLDRPVKVTAEHFDQILAGTTVPVLVDFYADWCGPCRMMAPAIDDLAAGRAGEALVLKVDTDRAQDLVMRFGIRGIPTLIAFQGGREIGRHVGLAQPRELAALLGAG